MRTKNAAAISADEGRYIALVKSLPCSVCDQPGPSDAHHIHQGQHYTVVALCRDCHQGAFNGWHGQRRIWLVKKLDELCALAITIRRVFDIMAQAAHHRRPARLGHAGAAGAVQPGPSPS